MSLPQRMHPGMQGWLDNGRAHSILLGLGRKDAEILHPRLSNTRSLVKTLLPENS